MKAILFLLLTVHAPSLVWGMESLPLETNEFMADLKLKWDPNLNKLKERAEKEGYEQELIEEIQAFSSSVTMHLYLYKAKYAEFKKAINGGKDKTITLDKIKLTVENREIYLDGHKANFLSVEKLFKEAIKYLEDLYKEILDLDPRRTRKLSRKKALALIQEHLDNALGNLRRRRGLFDEVSREKLDEEGLKGLPNTPRGNQSQDSENPQGKIEINIGPNKVVERKDDDLSEIYTHDE